MIKLRNCLIALVLILALSGCNKDVFYSAVSGRLIDNDTENGIAGVNVYAYTSEEERDSAFNSWKSGTIFSDNSCKFRATTDNNGNFSISKIIWTTNKPAWSEDYDSSSVYLIFFSEEYGLIKEGPIAVISSSSNQSAVTLRLERMEASSTLTLNFRDVTSAGQSKNVGDAINFTYSYSNGYRTITRDASTNTGTYTINVSYPKGKSAEVKIENISSPLDVWSPSASSYSFNVDKSSVVDYVDMKREKFSLENGIYGSITVEKDKYPNLSDASVSVNIGGVDYIVGVTGVEYVGPEAAPTYARATYSGLASGVYIDATYTGDALDEQSFSITAKDSGGNDLAIGTLKLSAASSSLECNLK